RAHGTRGLHEKGRNYLDGHRVVAAVDDELFAGDEGTGGVGGEEERGADELAGFAETFGGRVAEDGGDAVGGEDLAVLLGGEEAGDEDVDASLRGRPFAGEVKGEIVDGALRGGVGDDARERD